MDSNALESGSPARWRVLIATFVAYFYDSLDLAILAIVMPVILKVFHITLVQGGLLASTTMIGAAIGSILFGLIADNYGRKLAMVIGLFEFGIFTLGVYIISSWGQFMVLRFLTGLGIGGLWGPCAALVAEHWRAKYRARAESLVLSTFAIGSIAAGALGALVLASGNWRIIFLIGSTSILAAIYVWLTVPTSSRDLSGGSEGKEKVSLGELFSGKMVKITLLALLLNVFQMGGFWGTATWVPTFLVKVRGLTLTRMGIFMTALYVGMFVGYQLFAWLGDRIGRRAALALSFLADVIFIPVYLIARSPEFLFWFGPVMALGLGGVFGLMGSYYSELFPENIRALAGGFCFNVGRLGAVIAPYTVGYIGSVYGLGAGIGITPIIFILGAATLLFLPETLSRENPILET